MRIGQYEYFTSIHIYSYSEYISGGHTAYHPMYSQSDNLPSFWTMVLYLCNALQTYWPMSLLAYTPYGHMVLTYGPMTVSIGHKALQSYVSPTDTWYGLMHNWWQANNVRKRDCNTNFLMYQSIICIDMTDRLGYKFFNVSINYLYKSNNRQTIQIFTLFIKLFV